MKKIIVSIISCLLVASVYGRTFTVSLYDYTPSRGNGITEAEYTNDHGAIYNITQPRLDVYLPDKSGVPCLLALPGGGYRYVSARNEGSLLAENMLNDNVAVAVLKYRLPNGHAHIPLADAQRAMEILRDSAVQWGIDSSRIGVIGFSAGGHLAGCLLTQYKSPKCRPDFGILIYPVLTLDSALTHKVTRQQLFSDEVSARYMQRFSPVKNVSANTPPCIICACQDDKTVPVKNSILFFEALTKNGVEAELHIYPKGGHGWGFSRNFPSRYNFERSLMEWIQKH